GADVTDPQLVAARPEGEPERVAEAEGHDAPRVRIGRRGQGIAGESGARRRVDPDDGAVEAGGVSGRADVLAAQRTALGGRRGLERADPGRGVPARVQRVALLAVVREAEPRAIAGTGVERAVRAEQQGADGGAP